MRTKARNREEIAQWLVSIYQDAFLSKQTHEELLKSLTRVWESRDWKRLTQKDREYANGYARCYDVMWIQRQLTESGSWVLMPDGSEVYFGVRERLGFGTEELNKMYPELSIYGVHKYIHDYEIKGRAGIYWVDGDKWNGKHPFFIPKEDK